MKIYEIGTGYTPIPAQMGAATEIVVEELTRSLLESGFDAQIIDISAQSRAETALPITEVKVPAMFTKTDVSLGIMHKLKRVVYSMCLAKHLKKLLRKTNDEVVLHFHNQYNLFFALKLIPKNLLKKATVVYTVHSYIWHGKWDEIAADINKRYFQELYCLEHADAVCVLNENTQKNIVEHTKVSAEQVYLMVNGVNTRVYRPLESAEKDEIKAQHGLQGKTVFVQVGSVCERKNQLTSVELLLPLMKQNKNIVFCYAGGVISPEYQLAIESFAEQNQVKDQVIYAGELKPGKMINDMYNMAEAMIFPSKAEGFSLVIIEAMSAGTPVVIHQSLQFDLAKKCLQYSDAEGFTELLKEQALDPERHDVLSGESRQVVLDSYSWAKVAKDYVAVMQSTRKS